MSPPATPARRSRLAIGAVITGGALALATGTFFIGHAVASGNGGSTQAISTANAVNAATDASNGPTQSTACIGANLAAGTLKAVNGTTLTITEKDGKDVTVTTSSSTKITKVVSGSLSDITPGAAIGVRGTANGQSAMTADDIAIIPSDKAPNLGKLPKRAGAFAERFGLAFGTVKSVSGNTVVVQEPDGTTVTVTTSSSTKVQKTVNAQVKDLTVGQPVVAGGTASANGSIAATHVVQGSADLGFKSFGLGGLGNGGLGRMRPGAVPEPTEPSAAG